VTAPLLLAALLPGVYWDQPVESAPALKKAGVERLYAPAERVDAWRAAGFQVDAWDAAKHQKAEDPGVQWRMSQAAATQMPWVDANGWRFLREPGRTWFYQTGRGHAALAAAEAFAYGVDAVIQPETQDLEPLGRMLAFLRKLEAPRMYTLANIGIIDDGTDQTGEVLNLLARRNLLFTVVKAPQAELDLNIRMPQPDAADPFEFAVNARRKLTDEKRLVRIYGSQVVLVYFTTDGRRERLHLLNYSGRAVGGLRVRVLGPHARATAAFSGLPEAALTDWSAGPDAVEFTVPEMQVYTVVDLERK